jgi:hypothetical protein
MCLQRAVVGIPRHLTQRRALPARRKILQTRAVATIAAGIPRCRGAVVRAISELHSCGRSRADVALRDCHMLGECQNLVLRLRLFFRRDLTGYRSFVKLSGSNG